MSSFKAVHVWDDFNDLLDEGDPPDTASQAAIAGDVWVRVFTEVVAVDGIVYGVTVSAIVALGCLAVFTGNVLVALLAVKSIAANIVTMLALYQLWGWSLGAIEAISISILVGLSVD